MAAVSFVTSLHQKTDRDYVGRVTQADKAECAEVAKKFGKDYWDGDRKYGYGGYKYDGRWSVVAERMIARYNLSENARILDVGCGKGFLLHEFKKLLPKAEIRGIDISAYAIENAKEEVKEYLQIGNAIKLPFEDREFDLVYSITTLHNLYNYELKKAILEVQRVSKKNSFILVDSYRNERERVNLLYWQLTCESFFTPQEWVWLFNEYGYTGDYEFIYFE